jgi:hypothetical protein
MSGEENGGKGKESDLKAGHVRPKNECVRTYSCWVHVCQVSHAFERT